MKHIMRPVLVFSLAFGVSGCAALSGLGSGRSAPETPAVAASPDSQTVRPAGRPTGAGGPVAALGRGGNPVDGLDRTTPEQRAAARAPAAASSAVLGQTLASLGSPAEQGFWLRTGLVTENTPGRVTVRGSDASVAVELRPSGSDAGAGSQLSLAAFRALEQPLTGLLRLDVARE